MKKFIYLLILGMVVFGFINTANAQSYGRRQMGEGDKLVLKGQTSGAIVAYNDAKRVAAEDNDWDLLLALSSRYLRVKQEWAAQNAFSLAFRSAYYMAIGDPKKTGVPRDCENGRGGLFSVIGVFKNTLDGMTMKSATSKNLKFTVQQAENALNWLNQNHGQGCPGVKPDRVTVKTDKDVYVPNEEITVEWTGLPGNDQDWVAIYNSTGKRMHWSFSDNYEEGEITFGGLPAGNYTVYAAIEGSKTAATSYSFTVAGSSKRKRSIPPGSNIGWGATGKSFQGAESGDVLPVYCTPGGTLRPIWGTGIYTYDSGVCTAAVHAGVITQIDGGFCKIEFLGSQNSFEAGTQNGVSSGRWGYYRQSFRMLRD